MEIASRIMTLIDNAKSTLILVSPYISIDKWEKFKKCLQRAIDRDVNVTIYARENGDQDFKLLRTFNVKLVLVKDLHAKIYLNDSYAIATSQNILYYSDINSIDFGYQTQTDEERKDLLNLVSQYLVTEKTVMKEAVKKIIEVVKTIESPIVKVMKIELVQFLKSVEVKNIYEVFSKRYPSLKINNTSTYVYCRKLFPFGDVMFREGFEIRFNHAILDFDAVLQIVENLNLSSCHYNYKRELKMANNHPETLILVPQNVSNIDRLIDDYLHVTKIILAKSQKLIL